MRSWWRNLWRRVAEWRKWRAIERAERLVWSHGYGVYHRAYVEEAYERVAKLKDYAERSGHLTRGFHAGKRVQRDTADVVELLYAAKLLAERRVARVGRYTGEGPVHIGVVVGAVLGGVIAAVARGGSRSW